MKNTLFTFIFALASFAFVSSFLSCEKDTEIITETIVKTDTLFVTQTDTLILTELLHDTVTTFILLRHAETAGSGSNPNLSTAGQNRAEELRRIMENVELDAVFSTNFNRTLLTAQPTADDKSLTVSIYDAFNLVPFVDATLSEHHAGAVLVVGHSNTTSSILNTLVGANIYPDLPETEYDNLFVVSVFEKGRAEVVHLKYGE